MLKLEWNGYTRWWLTYTKGKQEPLSLCFDNAKTFGDDTLMLRYKGTFVGFVALPYIKNPEELFA